MAGRPMAKWNKLNVQTAKGQASVVQIGETAFDGRREIIDGGDDWSVVLVACGLWTQIQDVLLPSLMLTPDVIAELEASVLQDEGFRKDLARA
eukprot:977538-Lingulodinium_polyedra.AAC.1